MAYEEIGFLGRNIGVIIFVIFGLYGFFLLMGVIGKNIDETTRIIGGFCAIILGLIALNENNG